MFALSCPLLPDTGLFFVFLFSFIFFLCLLFSTFSLPSATPLSCHSFLPFSSALSSSSSFSFFHVPLPLLPIVFFLVLFPLLLIIFLFLFFQYASFASFFTLYSYSYRSIPSIHPLSILYPFFTGISSTCIFLAPPPPSIHHTSTHQF